MDFTLPEGSIKDNIEEILERVPMCIYELELEEGRLKSAIGQTRAAIANQNRNEKSHQIRAAQELSPQVIELEAKLVSTHALMRMWEEARDAAKKFLNAKF